MVSNEIDDEYISGALSVFVPEFTEKYIDSKTITVYIIEVNNNVTKQHWQLTKRYSEFENLYKNISKLFPNIPSIPGKSVFKITAIDALNKRRLELEVFLKHCAKRKDINSNEGFKAFLEIEKHAPELNYNAPTKLHSLDSLPLGIRDFYHFSKENMIFIVCCDMNISSRIDAYITNVNLPWEKKTNAHISVGAVFAYKITTNAEGHLYEKIWAKSFPEQTGVINYDQSNHMIQVGLDTGRILFYQTSEESRFIRYEERIEIKPHTNRVMGLAFNQDKGVIYSCSSDKKFVLTSFISPNSTVVAESTHGYTALVYDRHNNRIFLTNEGGLVSVFLTNEYIPLIVNVIPTHTANVIRGIYIDYMHSYLFTATNKGDISLLDLGLPGKEKLIKEMTYFSANVEIRVLWYNDEDNELYTGDQNGKVTVWNMKTAESIYAWQAHKDAITQMKFDFINRILITGSKDKKIIHWKIPVKWVNDEIDNFEKNEIKNLNDTIAMLHIQKALAKISKGDGDSSDDSLNGWDLINKQRR